MNEIQEALLDAKIQALQQELSRLQGKRIFESFDGKNIDPQTGLIIH